MAREIVIQPPFVDEGPNCQLPGECGKHRICERAFSTMISINDERNNPGQSDLEEELEETRCDHPQALGMVKLGKKVLRQTRG